MKFATMTASAAVLAFAATAATAHPEAQCACDHKMKDAQQQTQYERGSKDRRQTAGMERDRSDYADAKRTARADQERRSGDSERRQDRMAQWREMRNEAVSVSDILRGSVTNGLAQYGSVDNLVLSADGSSVEYVVIDSEGSVFNPLWDRGVIAFNQVDLESGFGMNGIDVNTAAEAEDARDGSGDLSRQDADRRLVSRIIDSDIRLSDGESRRIEDVLIDPQSGEVLFYVIGADADAIFSTSRQTVPADAVSYRNNAYRTSLSSRDIEGDQRYDSSLL